jgi:glycerol-3-phosphate dehydrogenase
VFVQDPDKMKEGTAALSRNHVVEVTPSKLVTITGGKWTTYRRMAEDTVDRLLKVTQHAWSTSGRAQGAACLA